MRSLMAIEGLFTNRAILFSAGASVFDFRALFGVAGSEDDGPASATAFRFELHMKSQGRVGFRAILNVLV